MSFNLNLKDLENDINNHKKIVLIVGAGINYSPNVKLMWNDIINPMFEYALQQICREEGIAGKDLRNLYKLFDIGNKFQENYNIQQEERYLSLKSKLQYEYGPLIKVAIVKDVLKSQYLYLLQNYIYNQCNKFMLRKIIEEDYSIESESWKVPKRFYTLYSIARMILLNPNIISVISYNYDNFLTQVIYILQNSPEKYFSEKEQIQIKRRNLVVSDKDKLKAEDIYGQFHKSSPLGYNFMIYHPHGYIPSPSETENLDDCQIVLSLDEYCENIRDVFSWVNDTQVHLLSHYTGIMIGSSFSDLTTQRMMYYATMNGNNDKIFYLNAYTKNNDTTSPLCEEAERSLLKIKSRFYESCGMTPIISVHGFDFLLKKLNEINTNYIEKNYKEII